jgi:hypothetical protein
MACTRFFGGCARPVHLAQSQDAVMLART